jgi:hypothetical protein
MLVSKKCDFIIELLNALKRERINITELEALSSKMVLRGTSFTLKLTYDIEGKSSPPFNRAALSIQQELNEYKRSSELEEERIMAWRSAGCSSSEEEEINTGIGLHATAAILEILLQEKKRNEQDLIRALEQLGVGLK